ncbi:PhzF family phenazine biosynthesis protein [Hyphococcus flavus]|uniref:PhzF family phenazine biosynthesis protein n=1 Tax=Hyphococcus flavus TaxID=1866326 RepID=A0AAE9ZG88_9PROT|nr:PhzF family phenazine biosynthesis protein [Hyphococcus flavus]WDI32373.1 PhzF family phenazine biosynthesis protein [Hyphococcus flavus]
MRAYDFETFDVFTKEKFTGNPLAVVMSAEGLSTEEMQTITREFNLAETSFVLPPEDSAHTARVRIFTPGYEMPFAGHPTVGTAIAIVRSRKLSGELLLELNAGLFPVRVDTDGDAEFAEFQNPNLPTETGLAPSADAIETALSLPSGSVDRGSFKPRKVGAGVNFIYVKAPLDVVRSARLNSAAYEALGLEETVGVYLYAEGGESADAAYHARMFAPDAGIFEDPATGSAACALPGHVVVSETLADGEYRWIIEQGFEMGRPSRIAATVAVQDGAVRSVRIGGNAVAVQKGQLFL